MRRLFPTLFLFFSIRALGASGIFYSTTTNALDYKDADGNTIVSIPSNMNMTFAGYGSGGGSASWGGITGTLTNQTDLNSALAGKAATSHTHAPADITGTAVITSDSRLSDARTPLAHNQAETTITFTNNTTGNASTSAHGYAPMGTVGTTQFWRQDWTLATPSASIAWGGITGTLSNQTDLNTALSGKQATLTRATGAMVYSALSNGTLALAFGTNSCVKVTPTATGSFTTTVPAAGNVSQLIILTSGTTSYTMTFGTGFKSTGTLATGTTTGKYFILTFVSDGTYMIEASRTVAQ